VHPCCRRPESPNPAGSLGIPMSASSPGDRPKLGGKLKLPSVSWLAVVGLSVGWAAGPGRSGPRTPWPSRISTTRHRWVAKADGFQSATRGRRLPNEFLLVVHLGLRCATKHLARRGAGLRRYSTSERRRVPSVVTTEPRRTCAGPAEQPAVPLSSHYSRRNREPQITSR